MKYLKSYKIFESVDSIKSDLEDIFLDIKDSNPGEGWFVWVEGDSVSNLYEVYISFGSEEPYHSDFNEFDDEDEEYHSDYNENQISQALVECLERSIYYMSSLGWRNTIQFCTEYSSDPSEDNCEVVEIGDIEPGQWIQENQAIRIKFRK